MEQQKEVTPTLMTVGYVDGGKRDKVFEITTDEVGGSMNVYFINDAGEEEGETRPLADLRIVSVR